MHREDLKRMADEWVTITEEVRADTDAWKLSGDIFTKKPGDKPWIAEMYGYSFAAARANIWHHTNNRQGMQDLNQKCRGLAFLCKPRFIHRAGQL